MGQLSPIVRYKLHCGPIIMMMFAGGVTSPEPDGGRGPRAPPLVQAGEARTDNPHAVDRHRRRHGPPRDHYRQVPHVDPPTPDTTPRRCYTTH